MPELGRSECAAERPGGGGAMRILHIHRDWEEALGGAPLAVRGSFRRVLNMELSVAGGNALGASSVAGAAGRPSGQVRDCGALLWIGARSCPFGPGAMILDCDELPAMLRSVGAVSVTRSGARSLELCAVRGGSPFARRASLPLSLEAEMRGPLPLGRRLATGSLGCSAAAGEGMLARWGHPSSPFVLGGEADDGLRGRSQESGRALAGMLASSAREELTGAEELLERFVGLGPGLTPSADDFVVGALAAWMFVAGPDETLRGVMEAAVRKAAPRTTAVAQLYLRAAARGEFSEQVTRAAWSLLDGCSQGPAWHSEASACPEEIASLLRHGSTSGTDVLSGMVYVCRAFADEGAR